MVSPLSSNVSAIQLLNAANAFRNASRPIAVEEKNVEDISEGTNLNDDSILKSQNLNEIREYAKLAGENNLSDEDIKYGLSYGRSVIVEYMA